MTENTTPDSVTRILRRRISVTRTSKGFSRDVTIEGSGEVPVSELIEEFALLFDAVGKIYPSEQEALQREAT